MRNHCSTGQYHSGQLSTARYCSSDSQYLNKKLADHVSVQRAVDTIRLRPTVRQGTLTGSYSGDTPAVMHSSSNDNNRQAYLYLRGPLRLVNEDGLDCTPKGGFRKALLALLVLSENHRRGRAWLQSVLWESSDEKKGAAGLRTALSTLRRELKAGLGVDLIVADSQSIGINLDSIWVDLFDTSLSLESVGDRLECEVLEGINLRTTGGESFEDWLRTERQFWTNRRDLQNQKDDIKESQSQIKPSSDAVPDTQSTIALSPKPGVGLLPVIVVSGGPATHLFADSILDCIASDLSSFGNIDIYDYREDSQRQYELNNGLGPQLLLRIKVAVENQQFSIHLCTYQANTQKVLGTGSVGGDFKDGLSVDNLIVSGFVAQNVDRILAWFDNSAKSGINEPGTPYQVLNTMFRFDDKSSDVAERLLLQTGSESSINVQIALQAYLQTFRVGEHWGKFDKDVYVNTRELVDQVLQGNSQNAIALCATGHALGFTLHEHELAIDLLKRSVQLGPAQAFCLDHLALAYLYRGEYDKAMTYAKRAIQVGAFSPLRFTYETTICMVATLQGDYKSAVYYGKRALSRRPNYGAALRYTSISLAHLNKLEEAAILLQRTRKMDDEFSLDWIEQGRLGFADGNAKLTIKSGLNKIGIQR